MFPPKKDRCPPFHITQTKEHGLTGNQVGSSHSVDGEIRLGVLLSADPLAVERNNVCVSWSPLSLTPRSSLRELRCLPDPGPATTTSCHRESSQQKEKGASVRRSCWTIPGGSTSKEALLFQVEEDFRVPSCSVFRKRFVWMEEVLIQQSPKDRSQVDEGRGHRKGRNCKLLNGVALQSCVEERGIVRVLETSCGSSVLCTWLCHAGVVYLAGSSHCLGVAQAPSTSDQGLAAVRLLKLNNPSRDMAVSLSGGGRSSDGAALAQAGRSKAFADVLSTINDKPVEVSGSLLDFEGASSGDRDARSREAAGGASSSVRARGPRPPRPVVWGAPVREAAGRISCST